MPWDGDKYNVSTTTIIPKFQKTQSDLENGFVGINTHKKDVCTLVL